MPASQVNEFILAEIFDGRPESISWMKPVWSSTDGYRDIIDFQLCYYNPTSAVMANIAEKNLIGSYLSNFSFLDITTQKLLFEQHLKVYLSGEPFDTTYYSSALKKHINTVRTKTGDGVLSISHNITPELNALEPKKEQNVFLDSVINGSVTGILSMEAVRNDRGEIVDFIMLSFNRAAEWILNISANEWIGKRYFSLFPQAAEFFEVHKKALLTGFTQRSELYYDDERLRAWFDFSAVKGGEDIIIATFNDITAKKAATLQIEKQKKLLDSVINNSTSGLLYCQSLQDEEGTITDFKPLLANQQAADLMGFSMDYFMSLSIRQIHEIRKATDIVEMYIKVVETGEPASVDYYFGSLQKWFGISAVRLEDGFLVTYTDITETKNLQLQLEKSIEDLRKSNVNLEEFAYAASHDLQEPIRKVHFFANRIKEQYLENFDETGIRYFDRLEVATERMRKLVEDLLAYSQASNIPLSFEEINLNQKLQLVLDDMEVGIADKKAQITIGQLPIIRGNRRQLQQLFQNLIGNALKYSKQNVIPQIHISSTVITGMESGLNLSPELLNKQYYLIEVKDNGIGFDQKDAERIFNVFQRLHGNAEYKGTGIGLSIARKVVENHNGFIYAKSIEGLGSSFFVGFPVD
ncbi:sensor histidine kinase [Segetibacter koreensis]|uniref:sensor histidine kinase n=1 Tax=Segetibacter koreensis TaxID=398037 RepID=UPI00035FD1C9|nr:PAS domain-containing sensor histidine kinase [Segetibacter koreensis]